MMSPVSLVSGNAFVSGPGSLRFRSWRVKLDAVLPTARHCCDVCLKGAVLLAGVMSRRWAPPTRYTLPRNTVSLAKDLVAMTSFAVPIVEAERRTVANLSKSLN